MKSTTRTISPFVHVYFGKTFSGKEGQFLFKDPERVSSWFKWDYKYLDVAYIQQKILNVVGKTNQKLKDFERLIIRLPENL